MGSVIFKAVTGCIEFWPLVKVWSTSKVATSSCFPILRQNMRVNGYMQAARVLPSGECVTGHDYVLAAREIGLKCYPVIVVVEYQRNGTKPKLKRSRITRG